MKEMSRGNLKVHLKQLTLPLFFMMNIHGVLTFYGGINCIQLLTSVNSHNPCSDAEKILLTTRTHEVNNLLK